MISLRDDTKGVIYGDFGEPKTAVALDADPPDPKDRFTHEQVRENPIGERALRGGSRQYTEVWTGIRTDDAAYASFQHGLFQRLQSVAPMSTYVTTDWSIVLNVQNVMGDPHGTPAFRSFSWAREELKKKKAKKPGRMEEATNVRMDDYINNGTFNADEAHRLATFYDIFIGEIGPAVNVPFRSSANIGLPTLSTKLPERLASIEAAQREAKLVGSLVRSQDYKTLTKMGYWFAFKNGFRSQVEPLTRNADGVLVPVKGEREVLNFLDQWVLSARAGSVTVPPPPKKDPHRAKGKFFTPQMIDRCATRSRQISMSALRSTYYLRCASRRVEHQIYTSFPWVTHHHGVGDVKSKMTGCLAWSISDVANHDFVINPLHGVQLARRLDQVVGPGFGEYFLALQNGCHIAESDYYGKPGLRVRGRLDRPFETGGEPGNPSGIATTSILAKAAGIWYAIEGAWRYANRRNLSEVRAGYEAFVRSVLAGTARFKLLNAGDNNFMFCFDSDWAEYVKDPGRWMPFAWLDDTETFLGQVAYGPKDRSPILLPNIETLIRNVVVPDRSVDHPLRGHPLLALEARKLVYSTHPAADAVFRALDEVALATLGEDLEGLARRTPFDEIVDKISAYDTFLKGRSSANAEFVLNPEAVEYKLDPMEIDPDLFDLFYTSVPAEDAERDLANFVGGLHR